MSLRDSFPQARLPRTHYFITLTRGDSMRTYAMRVGAARGLLLFAPLLTAAWLGAAAWFVWRDDMLASLMKRQAEMQYAYEDRLAAMRTQIDRVTSRQLLDQDSFDGRVQELMTRQAQLETRGAVVASLASRIDAPRDVATARVEPKPAPAGRHARAAAARAAVNPLLTNMGGPALPAAAQGFAPVAPILAPDSGVPAKPRIEESEETTQPGEAPRSRRGAALGPGAPAAAALDPDLPVERRLEHVARALDRVEKSQFRALAGIDARAHLSAQRLRAAFLAAGLSPDRLSPPKAAEGMGGPFIPLKVDLNGSPFERELARIQVSVVQADRLERVMPYVPLRQPLAGVLEATSPFGGRSDPFLGRAAMHSGVDLRGEYGAPIRATAAGRVTNAAYTGGYGNMVEIDHGNGLRTRYAHMSAILVEEGQDVRAGALVGRLGSTGRSTGPHLHYEVHTDGAAVDPTRFLRAGGRIFPRG